MRLELMLGLRYLMTKRKLSFVSIITFLCILGILVGVMVMITVMSVMNGFQEDIRDKILGMRSHISVSMYGDEPMSDYEAIIELAESGKSVISVYEYINAPAIMRVYTYSTLINMTAVEQDVFSSDQGYQKYFNFESGFADFTSSVSNVLIGSEMAYNYALSVGDTIDIVTASGTFERGFRPANKTLVISGIYKTGYYEYDSKVAIISLELAQELLGYENAVSGVSIKLDDFYKADRVAADLDNVMGGKYSVMPWMLFDRNFFNALKTEKTMLSLILFFIILVASLNIASSQIIFVKDKRRDIAILKTLGMKPSSIAKIFFLEGSIIGLVGTLLGVICGVLLASNVNGVLEAVRSILQALAYVIFYIPSMISSSVVVPYVPEFFPQDIYYVSGGLPTIIYPSQVLLVAIVSFLISVLFAIVPAYIATKYKPALVLRYE